jgi:hypothetical protein
MKLFALLTFFNYNKLVLSNVEKYKYVHTSAQEKYVGISNQRCYTWKFRSPFECDLMQQLETWVAATW